MLYFFGYIKLDYQQHSAFCLTQSFQIILNELKPFNYFATCHDTFTYLKKFFQQMKNLLKINSNNNVSYAL